MGLPIVLLSLVLDNKKVLNGMDLSEVGWGVLSVCCRGCLWTWIKAIHGSILLVVVVVVNKLNPQP